MDDQIISHYQIERKLGAGGMGEVYLAHDSSLNRPVALKILPAEFVSHPERLHRFIREAKAASAVNHPNVAHIYEIGEENGIHFIAMEYIEGESLASRMKRAPIKSAEITKIAYEIFEALEEAHAKGVIHRDIKPANIMISSSGRVKLVDFGLARIEQAETGMSSLLSTASQTELGTVIGTLPYMSPEQLLGQPVDRRSDFFSSGIVLYQMATRELPFQGNTTAELADAIIHKNPVSVRQLNHDVPNELGKIISWLLSKDPADRPESAAKVLDVIKKLPGKKAVLFSLSGLIRKPSVVISAVSVILLLIGAAYWFWNWNSKIRWAREEALPQITKFADEGQYEDAVRLGFEAEKYIPEDPILKTLWAGMASTISVKTDPPGADVFMKEYASPDENWKLAGKTPIDKLRVPKGHYRLKIVKPGFPEIFAVVPGGFWQTDASISYSLNQYKENPEGMVRIPGIRTDPNAATDQEKIPVENDYWIDRYEVTNKQFQEFLEGGGYHNKKYWKVPFTEEGRMISFDEAMTYFRDATGRPGPLEWEVGRFPAGQEDFPVTGISWYEAAAYAEFAGKNLPTLYHWYHASGSGINYLLVPASNFGGRGAHAEGNPHAMSPYGNVDMAGNVSEWCWNEVATGKRAIFGGSYADPVYMFLELNSRVPFYRDKTIGFRCVKYLVEDPTLELFSKKFEPVSRDYNKEKTASDEVYAVLKTFYDYEKKDLNSMTESVQEQSNLIKEKVTFNAPYGSERMSAYIFLPRNVRPPYQTIVYFPGAGAQYFSSSESMLQADFAEYGDFLIRSGRAFVYPIYKGTYERGGGPGTDRRTPDQLREWRIQYVKDFRRTLDYLETRNDIDMQKIAYFGSSWGGRTGSIIGAVEKRLKVMIMEHGGFPPDPHTPETDEINFAPRIGIPVLMINGSFDHIFPMRTSQQPMFAALGTAPKDKMHFVFEGGHITPRKEIIKVVLDWLDKYLGKPS